MKHKKTMAAFVGAGLFCSLLLSGRWAAAEEIRTGKEDVQIRKRAEWVDESQGLADITLEYKTSSEVITGTEDMDVVLIQDKSGSMDIDYGLHIYARYQGLSMEGAVYTWQPIRNSMGYSESGRDNAADASYMGKLHTDERNRLLYIGEYRYNAPCQMEDHYYYLTEYDTYSDKEKGTFVPGILLYNNLNTDLHHYIKLESRDEALFYLAQGRRVVRSGDYYTRDNVLHTLETESVYFLDVSSLVRIPGGEGEVLAVTADFCQENGRLQKSQEFMKRLVSMIYEQNSENRIAYVPFWCDVPEDEDGDGIGRWDNLSDGGNGTLQILQGEKLLQSEAGTYALSFQGQDRKEQLEGQIDHSFTYNGTNWSAAFRKAYEEIQAIRESEGTIRKTLVLFLTDGIPAGSQGQVTDYAHPLLNGINEVALLSQMDAVTIYSCGIGINESDTTGMKERLNALDSDGHAAFARTYEDFDALYRTILERVTEQYVIEIRAEELVYVDRLSEAFEPDWEKSEQMGLSWELLSEVTEAPDGIPEEVRSAFAAGNELVYVEDLHTVYWNIGSDQIQGDYDAPGHSIRFPVRFRYYSETTRPDPIPYASNDEQYLVYRSTRNPEMLQTVTMEEPVLIFYRQPEPLLQIDLSYINGWAKEDRSFLFLVTEERKENGYMPSETEQILSVTIPAGETKGRVTEQDASPGRHFVYRLDEMGRVQRETEKILETERTAEILTEEKGELCPPSAVTSDGTELLNRNNVLRILHKGASAEYVEELPDTAELTIRKTISADPEDIWWEHGDPTFLVSVTGTDKEGHSVTFNHTFVFAKEFVESSQAEGQVTLTWFLKDIPACEDYVVRELLTCGYLPEAITGNGDNVRIHTENPLLWAEVDLTEKREGTMVTIFNKKINYGLDRHVASVSNVIQYD